MDNEMRKVSSDIKYGIKWMIEIMNDILYSNPPLPEKLILEQRMKQRLGVTPQEFAAYLTWKNNYQDFQFKSNQIKQYILVKSFMGKLLKGVGIEPKYGEGVLAFWAVQKSIELGVQNRYEDWILPLVDLLGVRDEFFLIVNEDSKTNEGSRRFLLLLYRTLLKGLGVNESKINAIVARAPRTGNFDTQLADLLNQRIESLQKESLSKNVFSSFVFGHDFLKKRYNLQPVYTGVELLGLPSNGFLTRALFNADYALKYATTLNLGTVGIADFLSSSEYICKRADESGRSIELKQAIVRYWIYPGEVKFKIMSDKSGLYFVSSDVKIGCELFEGYSNQWLNSILNEYAEKVNRDYDKIARLYPSLHVIREVQKIIALVRWLKANNIQIILPSLELADNSIPKQVEQIVSLSFFNRSGGSFDNVFLNFEGGVVYSQEYGDKWYKGEPDPIVTKDVLHQLAASVVLAEMAADAGTMGDMESARELAEKSAQAMTGLIDFSRLPTLDIPGFDDAEPLPEGSVASQAIVSREVIYALDNNIQAYEKAEKQLSDAEQIKNSSPEKYQEAVNNVTTTQKRVKDNLTKLKVLLAYYRNKSEDYSSEVVDLRHLDPSKPLVVSLPPGGTQIPGAGQSSIGEEEILKILPDKDSLEAELRRLREELELTRQSLLRLNRTIQLDLQQFQEWHDEASNAITRLKTRNKEYFITLVSDKYFDSMKNYYKGKDDPATVEKIDRLEKAIATSQFLTVVADQAPFKEWKEIIAEGVVTAMNVFSDLSPEVQSYVGLFKYALDTGYDMTDCLISWKRIEQGNNNQENYLKAVRKTADLMKQIFDRIQETESQLKSIKK
jgi:hypothetical protein